MNSNKINNIKAQYASTFYTDTLFSLQTNAIQIFFEDMLFGFRNVTRSKSNVKKNDRN